MVKKCWLVPQGVLGIVLAKDKLVKFLKTSTVSQVVRKKWKLVDLLNPKLYSAEYFGHKNRYDQNEKLGMYGAVHVCARDGYSGMIVKFAAIPIKNTITWKKNSLTITQKTLNNTRPDSYLNVLTFLVTFIIPLFFMPDFNGLDKV